MKLNWTKTEDDILQNTYNYFDKEHISSLLKNRSWVAIQTRASKLGLYRLNYFSDQEIDFIKNNHNSMRSGEIGRILNRSSNVVENKARELGLRKQEVWSLDEEKLLLENHKMYTIDDLSRLLKRSVSSVYHKIQDLNIQTKRKRYTASDEEILLYLKITSEKVGRTPNRNELTNLGLPSEMTFSNRFGSYGKACKLAGLDVNAGYVSAKKYFSINGDLCLSNSEKNITDFLILNNIEFKKEVLYRSIFQAEAFGKMRCDWLLYDGTIVEYFGMSRNKKYKDKMIKKINLCKKYKLPLLCVTDKDLKELDRIFNSYI